MEFLFWQQANRTPETQFIFNLFHLLLAGLTLLAWLHQLRGLRGAGIKRRDWFLPLGFFLLVLQFGLLTLHFGAEFFLRKELEWGGVDRFSRGFMGIGLMLVVAGLSEDGPFPNLSLTRWLRRSCALVAALVLTDVLLSRSRAVSGEPTHSLPMLTVDLLMLLTVVAGMRAAVRAGSGGWRPHFIALAAVGVSLLLRGTALLLPVGSEILLWNAEQHVLSVALFAFAWAAGERSHNLLDRIFVRLNLTFIVLASLIMLITAGMEKYQYMRLTEERSTDLAEFLRGHVIYYREHGESLEAVFRHPEVVRRVVVEFGKLPELRVINVYVDGQRASFHYAPDWEIREEIVLLPGPDPPEAGPGIANGFQMVRLPLANVPSRNRIEFWGTMDYINEYIGQYLILIYSLFTLMVGLASGIIGIIVNDADRQLRQQYAELQETHQQLAQTAKLASIGELAGGMAHEINNPITSILSLASHLAEESGDAVPAPHRRKNLEVIAQQAERVSRIVGNLLTFARQSHLEVSRVDVAEVLDAALLLVGFRLQERGILVYREMDADPPFLLGDASRLTEVFVNLFTNAIDAMPTGGTLTVRVSPDSTPERGVRIAVTDTGCGIPAEQLPRIFDPFFTTKEPGRGTGLGLSISHGIVRDHKGQIRAESRPGTGTTLWVTLPRGGE